MLGNSVMVDLIGKLLICIFYLLLRESINRKHFDLIQIGQFCTDQGMQVQGMQANLNTANQITIALCSLVFACLIEFFLATQQYSKNISGGFLSFARKL